jgi:hypothetical protein
MASLVESNPSSNGAAAQWRQAQTQVLDFMRLHARQWWAIDRLAGATTLPQGYVTMLLVELWIEGKVAREWAGDHPIFRLQDPKAAGRESSGFGNGRAARRAARTDC